MSQEETDKGFDFDGSETQLEEDDDDELVERAIAQSIAEKVNDADRSTEEGSTEEGSGKESSEEEVSGEESSGEESSSESYSDSKSDYSDDDDDDDNKKYVLTSKGRKTLTSASKSIWSFVSKKKKRSNANVVKLMEKIHNLGLLIFLGIILFLCVFVMIQYRILSMFRGFSGVRNDVATGLKE